MWRSVLHTPHAWTARRTCPSPGSGSGSCAERSGVFGASSTIARMPAVCRQASPTLARSMSLSYRRLDGDELVRVGEIDRTEAIDTLFVHEQGSLREVHGDFSAAAWDPVGTGEHSVAAQRAALTRYVEKGAVCIGAFDDRLVGIGVVVPHLRPGVAQLAYLFVSD